MRLIRFFVGVVSPLAFTRLASARPGAGVTVRRLLHCVTASRLAAGSFYWKAAANAPQLD